MAYIRVEIRKNTVRGADRRARRACYGVTRRMAEDIAERARQYILAQGLVDTGELYSSVRAQPQLNRTYNAHEVVADARHAIFHEFGTRFMPAHPFLQPAVEDIEPFYEQRIADALNRTFSDPNDITLDTGLDASYFGDMD